METNKERTYTAKIYNGKRMVVSMHPFNPFKNKVAFVGQKKSKNFSEVMSRKDYQTTIKRWCAELWKYKIDSNECKFITLTLANNLSWKDLLNAFKLFMRSVERHFGKVEYIRGIEVQSESKYFHIHLILIFPNTPPTITNEWLDNHWQYGLSYIDNNINVYDVYGLIEYLTLFKVGSCQDNCFNATHFPKGVRLIAKSYNLPKTSVREIELSEEEFNHLYNIHYNDYCNNKGKLIREDGHYYPTENGLAYCADRTYFQLLEGFIESNYGTEEQIKAIDKNKS